MQLKRLWVLGILVGVLVFGFGLSFLTLRQLIVFGLFGFYSALSIQAGTFLYWSLYAWSDPDAIEGYKSPTLRHAPQLSFTALLAVRHETAVIADTIAAIAAIDYPEHLKELFVLIRSDDTETIAAAKHAISLLGRPTSAHVIEVDDLPVNKPNQLNWGLRSARNDVVVVFDAEDQPHADIYSIVNTVMIRDSADVVQSGVQLVNFTSRWFSALNCLEYYFWFKSVLLWFAKQGVVPLGGNTVFFKRHLLTAAGGWNEHCLTEDGEVGLRLSRMGAKIAVVYDETHATQEETPVDIAEFIKQRTRWNQGFLQIFFAGTWARFGTGRQKFLAAYLLLLPIFVTLMLFSSPLLAVVGVWYRLPLWLSLYSFLPVWLLAMFVGLLVFGSIQFARSYRLSYPWWMPIRIVLTIFPYQVALVIAAVRAVLRFVLRSGAWEKTAHVNAHREPSSYAA